MTPCEKNLDLVASILLNTFWQQVFVPFHVSEEWEANYYLKLLPGISDINPLIDIPMWPYKKIPGTC